LEALKEHWQIIVAAVASLAWIVRLEAMAKGNSAEIRRLWAQRKEDLASAKDSRDATNRKLDEIQSDIKALLRERRD
jgi:hypothetical protein